MTQYLISSMVNQETDYDACATFCVTLDAFKRYLNGRLPSADGDSYHTVYIHFVFDCEDMPGTVRGIKIGRYIKKTRSIGIDAQVERLVFKPLPPVQQTGLIAKTISESLQRLKAKKTPIPDSDIDLLLDLLPE